MVNKCLGWIAACICVALSVPAFADWMVGDPHKMHFPQLPDPLGWDVEFVSPTNKIGDDWVCTQSGPVDDIHIWLSWQEDNHGLPGVIHHVGVEIYDNVPPDGLLPYSRPGQLLWSRVFDEALGGFTRRPYGAGDQGWYSPQLGTQPGVAWNRPDHALFEQLNITHIADPFVQIQGQTYWLVMWVSWDDLVQSPAGWKTADVNAYPPPFTGQHFMDDAVWFDWTEPDPLLVWNELRDPITEASLDLAFVITPEPGTLMVVLIGLGVGLKWRRR